MKMLILVKMSKCQCVLLSATITPMLNYHHSNSTHRKKLLWGPFINWHISKNIALGSKGRVGFGEVFGKNHSKMYKRKQIFTHTIRWSKWIALLNWSRFFVHFIRLFACKTFPYLFPRVDFYVRNRFDQMSHSWSIVYDVRDVHKGFLRIYKSS